MKRSFLLISAWLALILTSCTISVSIQMPSTPVPSATAQPSSTAVPTSTPMLAATLAPTRTLSPLEMTAVPVDGKPRTLYILAQSAVWVIHPETPQLARMTPFDSLVTAFDVWPEDGRWAYGTKSGKLYVVLPGEQPRLLVKLHTETDFSPFINGLDWSPDGNRLAYTVDYDGSGQNVLAAYPSSPSGVWVVSLQSGLSTWLMSNHYLADANSKVNDVRRLYAPGWSQDGNALLLQGLYWEWSNTHWLSPLQFAEDDRYLYNPPNAQAGEGWTSAAWMPDGQSLVFSGQQGTTYGSLVWASRDGQKMDTWIDGTKANLYIYDAYPVPEGSYLPGNTPGLHGGQSIITRVVFLANCAACDSPTPARLFAEIFIDGALQGQPVGPEKLCMRTDAYGNPNTPRHIEWRPDFSAGVLTCGPNEMYLINMRRETPELTDLMPSLAPIAGDETPVFRWGE